MPTLALACITRILFDDNGKLVPYYTVSRNGVEAPEQDSTKLDIGASENQVRSSVIAHAKVVAAREFGITFQPSDTIKLCAPTFTES